jgi:hypothetical protein
MLNHISDSADQLKYQQISRTCCTSFADHSQCIHKEGSTDVCAWAQLLLSYLDFKESIQSGVHLHQSIPGTSTGNYEALATAYLM